jgi:molecular chaperone GrpE (heat shock protein)
MSLTEAPRTAKWPFFLADLILLGTAAWLVMKSEGAWTWREALAIAGLVGLGAWILTIPFVRDHEAAVKLWEQANLAGATERLNQLDAVARQIASATGQWHEAQKLSAGTVATAGDIAGRLTTEARNFSEFLAKSNDGERQTLRLEIDKLRRGEQDTVSAVLLLLDHSFALFQAGVRSGQPQLIQQLGQYRAACLDGVRRLGIIAHEAGPGEPFDPQRHQTVDGAEPAAGTPIEGTVACGYGYQGSVVRKIVVEVAAGAAVSGDAPEAAGSSPS